MSHSVSSVEYAHIAAGRLITSRSCGFFYVSLLAASITETVWILYPWMNVESCCHIRFPESPLFFLVEAYLTIGLVADVSARGVWERGAFCAQRGNVFDAIVCGLSILSFGLYYARVDDQVEAAVLLIRLAWLVLRLVRLVAIVQKINRRNAARHLDVSFPDDDDCDELNDVEGGNAGAYKRPAVGRTACVESTASSV